MLSISRKSVVLLFLLTFSSCLLRGQSSIDSLQRVVSALPSDTSKVTVLLQLANEHFWAGNYEQALASAGAADELATNVVYIKGQGKAQIVAGQTLIRMGRYDDALQSFSEAVKIFTTIGSKADLANSHLYLGQVFDFKAEYNMALEQYGIAFSFAREVNDSVSLTKVSNSKGITYFNKGDFEVALEHYLSALKLTPVKGNEKVYATILNNIGVVNLQMMQYEEALTYFNQHLKIMQALKGTHGLGVGHLNLGEVNKHLGRYDEALRHLNEAATIQSQTGDKKGLALSYSNMGDVYKRLKEFQKASDYYNQSITIARTIKNNEVLLNPLTGSAELYAMNGKYALAQTALNESRQIANEIGSKAWLQRAYLITSKLDSARGNYKDAYLWFKRYASLSDTLFNQKKSQQIFQMKERYESEKKDKEILLLSQSNKVAEVQQKSTKTLFTISMAFLSLVILIILYWLALKTRHSRILRQQTEELTRAHEQQKNLIEKIEAQRQELAVKNADLHSLHREKDDLIGIVVHDLRSPLNRILGLSNLVSLSGSTNAEQQLMLETINKVCGDGNVLISDLLELNEYESVGKVTLQPVDLRHLIEGHLKQFDKQLAAKELSLNFSSSTDVHTVNTNEQYLKRILDNLISNAIKFSPRYTEISISLEENENSHTVTIQDQGPGFTESDLPHVFQKFKKLSARPTAGETSTGLGLSIVKLLVEKIGGVIRVVRREGEGAIFELELPKSEAVQTEAGVNWLTKEARSGIKI